MASGRADVVVIGAGVIGCAVAWRLAQAGLAVAVIERGEPGREASWAAAGILGAQMESHGPGPMLELTLASRALHPGMARELLEATGIDVRCRIGGLLELAFSEEEAGELRARFEWQTRAGLRAEWFEQQRLHLVDAPQAALAGLLFPEDGQVDNRRLAEVLRVVAERAGASIVRGEAREVLEEGGQVIGVRVEDSRGAPAANLVARGNHFAAPKVVVAAGSWSALVRGAAIAEGAVRPVRGQMIAFPAAPGLGARVLSCASGYAVPREDRVLVGATVEEVGFEKANTREGLAGLLITAERLMPGSSAQKILEQWSGLRPGSRDGLPLLGAPADGPRGLFVCTGHHRNGILLTPISAELIRDAVLGRTPSRDLAPFRPDRF